jgi:ferredoxin
MSTTSDPKGGGRMRIAISAELCSGQGRCYSVSPDLFTSDDEGFVVQRGTEFEVPAGLEDQARLAVASCPVGAIRVVGES